MDIVVLPRLEGGVIARELQFGKPEGEFCVEGDGTVVYRSPYDARHWYAAPSANVFLEAADCWARYCERVAQAGSEGAKVAAVAELREGLSRLGLLASSGSSVWSAYVEQAEHGLL
jgi:hypothetical protein